MTSRRLTYNCSVVVTKVLILFGHATPALSVTISDVMAVKPLYSTLQNKPRFDRGHDAAFEEDEIPNL